MKQFSLETYLKNPNQMIVTRTGMPVRIICTDRIGTPNSPEQHIVGLVLTEDGYESIMSFYENGRWSICKETDYDLFFVPQKKSRWVYLYNTQASDNGWIECVSIAYDNKDEAIRYMKEDDGYALTEITWEE